MRISIDRDSSIPIYSQIEAEIKKNILNNVLVYGTRLPSERRQASNLGVHRNTVIRAYKNLADQQFISSNFEGRKGYFVIFGGHDTQEPAPSKEHSAVFRYSRDVSRYAAIFDQIYSASFSEGYISFGGHVLPKELIPLKEIKEVLFSVVERRGADAFFHCSSTGSLELRQEISHALLEEGIRVTPGKIVIINEAVQGLDIVSKLLAAKHDYVISESPIMPDTFTNFQNQGLRVLTAPLEEDGVNLVELENLFRQYRPKFFHTMPDYHAVTGACMSLEKRYALLELARKYDVPLVEERWHADICFTNDVLPSLYALDRRENVICIDSALTYFYYGARICYLLAPIDMAKRIARIICTSLIHLPSLEQAMFAEFLDRGYHIEQRRNMNCFYREKSRRLYEALMPLKTLGLSAGRPQGGLGLWCRLPNGVNDMRLYKNLRNSGVLICPGKLFYPYGTGDGSFMRLSFSNITDEKIETGVQMIYDELRRQLE